MWIQNSSNFVLLLGQVVSQEFPKKQLIYVGVPLDQPLELLLAT